MRPTLKQLCDINTGELRLLTHYEASKKIIDACIEKRSELAERLHKARLNDHDSYKVVSLLTAKIKYLNKAIESRTNDYNEMMEDW